MSASVVPIRAPGARVLPFRSPRFRADVVSSFDLVRAFWEARGVLPYDVFQKLASAQKATAFSTALNLETDLLKAILADLETVRNAGGDVKDFRDLVQGTLDQFGASLEDVAPSRLQLIYQQETTTAANAGIYGEMFSPEGMAAAEVWEFHAARETVEEHPDEVCALLDGKLFWKDDTASYRFLPQLHFRCRCIAISRQYEEGMEVQGGMQVTQTPDDGFDHDKLAPLTGTYGHLGKGGP